MTAVRRAGVILGLIAVALLLWTMLGDPARWMDDRLAKLLDSTGVGWLTDREAPVAISAEDLSAYTRTVAGEKSFQDVFLRMAFGDEGGSDAYSGRITKWDKRRVDVAFLNDPGPEMERFVSSLIVRLNTVQKATVFEVVDAPADITLRFVSHESYIRNVSHQSVGHCRVSYYLGRSSLISAAITIDGGALRTIETRKPVVVHELTHAIGFRGHLVDASQRESSVLYYTPVLSGWTQDDRAAIRILYSSNMRSGLTVNGARRALDRIAAARSN